MDPVTHFLSGAVLGRAWARPGGLPVRQAVLGGALAGTFPDIDYVASPFVDPLTFLNVHRGITHALPVLPLWGFLVAGLLALLFRCGLSGWRPWYPLVLAALLLHVGLDALTSYGTRLFAPFAQEAVAFPVLFIIDPLLTGTLVVALILSAWRPALRAPSLAGLALLAIYLPAQVGMMLKAGQLADRHAQALGLDDGYRVTAMAQPLSPLHWKLVVEEPGTYRVALVDLGAHQVPEPAADDAPLWRRVDALYRPPGALEWETYRRADDGDAGELVRRAWQAPSLAAYREFARYAYLERVVDGCAFFADLRFSLGDLRVPFRYGACPEAGGNGGAYRLEAGRPVPL